MRSTPRNHIYRFGHGLGLYKSHVDVFGDSRVSPTARDVNRLLPIYAYDGLVSFFYMSQNEVYLQVMGTRPILFSRSEIGHFSRLWHSTFNGRTHRRDPLSTIMSLYKRLQMKRSHMSPSPVLPTLDTTRGELRSNHFTTSVSGDILAALVERSMFDGSRAGEMEIVTNRIGRSGPIRLGCTWLPRSIGETLLAAQESLRGGVSDTIRYNTNLEAILVELLICRAILHVRGGDLSLVDKCIAMHLQFRDLSSIISPQISFELEGLLGQTPTRFLLNKSGTKISIHHQISNIKQYESAQSYTMPNL